MVQMTALKAFLYARRKLQPGDEFTASNMDARTLAAIGKAKRKTLTLPKRKYQRRDMTAE